MQNVNPSILKDGQPFFDEAVYLTVNPTRRAVAGAFDNSVLPQPIPMGHERIRLNWKTVKTNADGTMVLVDKEIG